MKYFFLFIPLCILLLSTNIVIVEINNNREGLEKEQTDNLLTYFLGGELQKEWYSEREVLHLKDVRTLIQISFFVMILFLVINIWSAWNEPRKIRQKGLVKGGALGMILIGLVAATLLNFSTSFITFHELFFRNDYWLLPADSTLIQLFPESFFITAVEHILLYSSLFFIACILIGMRGTQKWLTRSRCIRRRRASSARK